MSRRESPNASDVSQTVNLDLTMVFEGLVEDKKVEFENGWQESIREK